MTTSFTQQPTEIPEVTQKNIETQSNTAYLG